VEVAVDVRREDDELVAADATDGVHRSENCGEAFGDPSQDVVAGVMPAGVVDLFESIEVDKQDRGPSARARFGKPVRVSWVACSVSAA
jgi:hypothetical protein